ncbi:MAG: sporulation membrane protein YtaF [Peptococcaceae bacterium]|nr:sporulation membrane protein YtaF [Peptococcaceae bacterium]MDH7523959.1 sporulation membrane protein YtaF [Peptococcaceae bacterium]
MFWTTVLFSLALSLDGLGVGLSYGLQKIKIRVLSFAVICLSSAAAVAVSMLAGSAVASFLPAWLASIAGGLFLIVLGGWIIMQNFILYLVPARIYHFRLPGLGLAISILKEPAEADLDRSGTIELKEAALLGAALAMDALGAGFGAALSGFDPFWTPVVVAASKFLLVSLGLFIGKNFAAGGLRNELCLLPGGIILLLGVTKLIKL